MWNPPLVSTSFSLSCFRNQKSLTLGLGGNRLHFYIIVTFVIETVILIHNIFCPFLSLYLVLVAAFEKIYYFPYLWRQSPIRFNLLLLKLWKVFFVCAFLLRKLFQMLYGWRWCAHLCVCPLGGKLSDIGILFVYSFIFLLLENYGVRKLEAVFAFLITTMGLSFAWMFVDAKPSKKELLIG